MIDRYKDIVIYLHKIVKCRTGKVTPDMKTDNVVYLRTAVNVTLFKCY